MQAAVAAWRTVGGTKKAARGEKTPVAGGLCRARSVGVVFVCGVFHHGTVLFAGTAIAVALKFKFQMFAAFGMGETGKVSRLWSLKEGANLTYGSIGRSEAPGQIDVSVMGRALDQFDSLNSQMEILAFLNQF